MIIVEEFHLNWDNKPVTDWYMLVDSEKTAKYLVEKHIELQYSNSDLYEVDSNKGLYFIKHKDNALSKGYESIIVYNPPKVKTKQDIIDALFKIKNNSKFDKIINTIEFKN